MIVTCVVVKKKEELFDIHLLVLDVEKHFVASIVSHLVILVQMTYCKHTCIQKESGWEEEVSPVSFRHTLISSYLFFVGLNAKNRNTVFYWK